MLENIEMVFKSFKRQETIELPENEFYYHEIIGGAKVVEEMEMN